MNGLNGMSLKEVGVVAALVGIALGLLIGAQTLVEVDLIAMPPAPRQGCSACGG